MLEQSLSKAEKDTQVFNCSDGAKIHGAQPLPLEHILITTDTADKKAALNAVTERAFTKLDVTRFSTDYNAKYQQEALQEDLCSFKKIIANQATSKADANSKVENQKKLLFESYQRGNSYMFYYLFGTTNYANAVLSRLLTSSSDDDTCLVRFNQALTIWSKYMEMIIEEVSNSKLPRDASSSVQWFKTWDSFVAQNTQGISLTVVTNSTLFSDSILFYINSFLTQRQWQAKVLKVMSFEQVKSETSHHSDYVIYLKSQEFSDHGVYQRYLEQDTLPMQGHKGTFVCIDNNDDFAQVSNKNLSKSNTSVLTFLGHDHRADWINSKIMFAYAALRFLADSGQNLLFFPKYKILEEHTLLMQDDIFTPFSDADSIYWDFKEYIAINHSENKNLSLNHYGIRGKKLYRTTLQNMIYAELSTDTMNQWQGVFRQHLPHLVQDIEFKGKQIKTYKQPEGE